MASILPHNVDPNRKGGLFMAVYHFPIIEFLLKEHSTPVFYVPVCCIDTATIAARRRYWSNHPKNWHAISHHTSFAPFRILYINSYKITLFQKKIFWNTTLECTACYKEYFKCFRMFEIFFKILKQFNIMLLYNPLFRVTVIKSFLSFFA